MRLPSFAMPRPGGVLSAAAAFVAATLFLFRLLFLWGPLSALRNRSLVAFRLFGGSRWGFDPSLVAMVHGSPPKHKSSRKPGRTRAAEQRPLAGDRPNLHRTQSILDCFDQSRAEFDKKWADLASIGLESTETGVISTECRPKFTNVGPKSTKGCTNICRFRFSRTRKLVSRWPGRSVSVAFVTTLACSHLAPRSRPAILRHLLQARGDVRPTDFLHRRLGTLLGEPLAPHHVELLAFVCVVRSLACSSSPPCRFRGCSLTLGVPCGVWQVPFLAAGLWEVTLCHTTSDPLPR